MRVQAIPPQSGAIDQNEQPLAHDGWGRPIAPVNNQKAAPAPRHNISGTWEPANGFLDGLGPYGAKAMPEDGRPEHELSYTPLGMEALRRNMPMPTIGLRSVLPGETNDPVNFCDPQGFPR